MLQATLEGFQIPRFDGTAETPQARFEYLLALGQRKTVMSQLGRTLQQLKRDCGPNSGERLLKACERLHTKHLAEMNDSLVAFSELVRPERYHYYVYLAKMTLALRTDNGDPKFPLIGTSTTLDVQMDKLSDALTYLANEVECRYRSASVELNALSGDVEFSAIARPLYEEVRRRAERIEAEKRPMIWNALTLCSREEQARSFTPQCERAFELKEEKEGMTSPKRKKRFRHRRLTRSNDNNVESAFD